MRAFLLASAPADPFLLHLYAALAQKERALISRRTKEALQAAKARGVKLGCPNGAKHLRNNRSGVEALQRGADERAKALEATIDAIRAQRRHVC
jgi:DNA invertase Pin-like site-specific DNA recombinase